MRLLSWLNRTARRWWPLIASTVAGVILATMVYVVSVVAEDREQLREQRDLLADQSAQLADIIDRGRRQDAGSEQRLQSAVGSVEEMLIDHFALHDDNISQKLNEMLRRIEALLGRPAGEPLDPVTARPVAPSTPHRAPRAAPAPSRQPSVSPRPAPAPAPTSPPPPTPTTPDQRSCAKRPSGPRC